MSFSIVACLSSNNVIGNNNKLPWNIPEELEHFYKLVYGKPVVMGHKTYESIGRPIKHSRNIILSHDTSLKIPGCEVYNSIEAVLKLDQPNIEFMVIGGASIYQQFLPFANKMYLTFIDHDFEGDAYFPKWLTHEWKIISENIIPTNSYRCKFVVLQRNAD